MKVVFRTDASLQIGTGHVMRCLTLADVLKAQGARCEFICREHPGHLIDFIRAKGYVVYSLPMESDADSDLAHSHWLGATQTQDACRCEPLLAGLQPDWTIVDHYGLDARWEKMLEPHYDQLMVIDDLADRAHICQLLLDQTFGRARSDYHPLVPEHCMLLCGSFYALLRPEFAALREYSLQRRAAFQLKHILISMGGVDKDNVTSKVLTALRNCPIPHDCGLTVVMGSTAPWLIEVQQQAQGMPWPTTVRVGVNNMAQLMVDSDLAIGAAGATSWERCCMGLPSIMVVLAENQRCIAQALSMAGAAILLDVKDLDGRNEDLTKLIDTNRFDQVSKAAADIIDGLGAVRVAASLLSKVKDAY